MVDLSYYDIGAGGNWYALVSYYEGMREHVYSVLNKHEIEPLYVETMLEPLIEKSPVLILLNTMDDPITEKLPAENTLYFCANMDVLFEQVINHLRLRMNILFDGNRRGLFHFYHPTVASYFFALSDPQETLQWLSPISAILVYKQIHSQPDDWIFVNLPESVSDNDAQDRIWSIAASQHNALLQQMDEKDIIEWKHEHDFQEIYWKRQLKVKTFSEQTGLTHSSMIASLRNFIQETGIDIDDFYFDQHQLHQLDQFDKLKYIEETVAREFIHVR